MNRIDAPSWADEMDVRVTVCDRSATIVYMNPASAEGFQKRGGMALIGRSLFDCHNEKSNQKIREMLEKPQTHVYVLKKPDEKRLIRQFPWIENGAHMGIIEISFPLPDEGPL